MVPCCQFPPLDFLYALLVGYNLFRHFFLFLVALPGQYSTVRRKKPEKK